MKDMERHERRDYDYREMQLQSSQANWGIQWIVVMQVPLCIKVEGKEETKITTEQSQPQSQIVVLYIMVQVVVSCKKLIEPVENKWNEHLPQAFTRSEHLRGSLLGARATYNEDVIAIRRGPYCVVAFHFSYPQPRVYLFFPISSSPFVTNYGA